MGERPNLKLSEETGNETREALKKYRDAYELNSQEEAIRQLLPEWTFNPLVPATMGRLKEITKDSRHHDLDLSDINNVGDLSELADEAAKQGNSELASEIRAILQSHSSTTNSE